MDVIKSTVAKLNDEIPVLLMPLRLQLRFMTVKHFAQVENPSQVARLSSAGAAAPAAARQKAEGLTTSILSRKKLPAGVLLPAWENTAQGAFPQVDDTFELWLRIYPDEIFFHTHEESLTDNEAEAGKIYWVEIWNACKNADAEVDPAESQAILENGKLGAWQALVNKYGTSRAAWIRRATLPSNRKETDPEFTESPVFGPIHTKPFTWNEAPKTYVLPERFAVRLYKQNGTFKEFQGNPVVQPLQVGLDPNDAQEDAFEDTSEGRVVPEKLKWLTDFEAAVQAGMAIRIPLDDAEAQLAKQATQDVFSKLVVLGVKSDTDPSVQSAQLERLLENHYYKSDGFSIVPQGAPTNNTSEKNVVKGIEDLEAEQSHALVRGERAFDSSPGLPDNEKADGRRLQEALGVESHIFGQMQNGTTTDVSDAGKMNTLLWPATWGYFLQQFFFDLIDEHELRLVKQYFTEKVSGRGIIPIVRAGNQPYGILPTSAFSKWQYRTVKSDMDALLDKMHQKILKPLDGIWKNFLPYVHHISKNITGGITASEILNQILELHPSSLEFYQRSILGKEFVGSVNTFLALENKPSVGVSNFESKEVIKSRLDAAKLPLTADHFIFNYIYSDARSLLNGPMIDDFALLSEEQPIKPLQGSNLNYLGWMGSLQTKFRNLFLEDFSSIGDNPAGPPKALLYLLMRHALMRQYLDTAIHLGLSESPIRNVYARDFEYNALLVEEIGTVAANAVFEASYKSSLRTLRVNEVNREAAAQFPGEENAEARQAYIDEQLQGVDDHVEATFKQTQPELVKLYFDNKRWNLLDAKKDGGQQRLEDFIETNLESSNHTQEALKELYDYKQLLGSFANKPTAALERLLAEHLDLCQYRLDAWMLGLANQRLHDLRKKQPQGIYLGAFGYLESIRPKAPMGIGQTVVSAQNLQNITSAARLQPLFDDNGFNPALGSIDQLLAGGYVYLGPPTSDPGVEVAESGRLIPLPQAIPGNQGFIPTPSLSHAVAAAILRNAYTSYKKTNAPDEVFAVNLSSARVREAVYFMEGMINGQELGALLGYKFERALRQSPMNLVRHIFEFRQKYPIKAKDIDNPQGPSETISANSVTNGLDLLKTYRENIGNNSWLPAVVTNGSEINLVKNIADKLEETLDAVKDLLVAEMVYQLAKGNVDRARAAIKALNDGEASQMPEIMDIPRSGIPVKHRVGVILPKNGSASEWGGTPTPRSILAPRLNRWLAEKLPDPVNIKVRVRWITGTGANDEPIYEYANIRLNYLLVQPVDLIYLMLLFRNNKEESELLYRIDAFVRDYKNLADHQMVEIVEADRTGMDEDDFTLYELEPLIFALADLVVQSRPLKPQDLVPDHDPRHPGANANIDVQRMRNEINSYLNIFEKKTHDLRVKADSLANVFNPADRSLLVSEMDAYDVAKATAKMMTYFLGTGWQEALPQRKLPEDAFGLYGFMRQALTVTERAEKVLAGTRASLDALFADADQDKAAIADGMIKLVQGIFGESFRYVPVFNLPDQDSFQNAMNHANLLADAGDFAVERWAQSLAPVRRPMYLWQKVNLLTSMIVPEASGQELQPVQLPYDPSGNDRWAAMPYSEVYQPDGRTLCLALDLYSDFDVQNATQSGLVFDDWTEMIPEKEIGAGVAMHYDQPNSEAPNAMLLAVSPNLTGNWDWDDLVDTVIETMELSKKRAVDPDLMQNKLLSQILPATVAAINTDGVTVSLDYGKNRTTTTAAGESGLVIKDVLARLNKLDKIIPHLPNISFF